MSQTSKIFMVVFIAFVIFITVRGELNDYLEIFGFGGGNLPNDTGSSSGSGSGSFLPSLPSIPSLPQTFSI